MPTASARRSHTDPLRSASSLAWITSEAIPYAVSPASTGTGRQPPRMAKQAGPANSSACTILSAWAKSVGPPGVGVNKA